MDKYVTQQALIGLSEARATWKEANKNFATDVDRIMGRLLHEAARNFMSPAEVSRFSGFPLKQIRTRMKAVGLNPTAGKRMLSEEAAKNLAENAEILGIEPHEVDLMSPLAYLPMGKEMRETFLETHQGVTELDTFPEWLHQRLGDKHQEWDEMTEDDQAFWAHEAAAVRRAADRNGFKA